MRASGVPVRALKVRPQPSGGRQRNRCWLLFVQAVLDDTHRAAMRAPARGGQIDDLFPINASNAGLAAVARANRSIRTHCSAVIECRIAHSTAPNANSSMPVLP